MTTERQVAGAALIISSILFGAFLAYLLINLSTLPPTVEAIPGQIVSEEAKEFLRGASVVQFVQGLMVLWVLVGGFIVVVLMVFHILKFERLKRAALTAESPADGGEAETVIRFSKVQRLSHLFIALCWTLLLFTGLFVTLHDYVGWLSAIMPPDPRAALHRFAGFAGGFACVFYFTFIVLFVVFIDRGPLKRLIPLSWGSIKAFFSELVADVKFTLGLAEEPPKAGKYTYFEKIDILFLTFEAAVFGATGFVLWAGRYFATLMPKHYLLAFRWVHGAFAIVSGMGIIMHLFIVHLRPDKFPLNPSIFTGEVPLEEVREERPLWLEELGVEGGRSSSARGPAGGTRGILSLVLGLVLLALITSLWVAGTVRMANGLKVEPLRSWISSSIPWLTPAYDAAYALLGPVVRAMAALVAAAGPLFAGLVGLALFALLGGVVGLAYGIVKAIRKS